MYSSKNTIIADSCRVNNGGCDKNAICSHVPTTNAIKCACKTGYKNTGSNGQVVCVLASGRCVAKINPTHTNIKHRSFKNGSCPTSSDGCRYGWHFTTPDISSLFVSIDCQFQKAGSVTKMIQTPSTQHAYVFTSTDDTLISASAVINGVSQSFSLNHVCIPSS